MSSASLAQLSGGFCHVQFVTAKATIPRIRHSERKPEERAVRLLAAPCSQPRLEAHSCPSPSAAFPPHYGAPPTSAGEHFILLQDMDLVSKPTACRHSLCSAPTCLHAPLHTAVPELPITPALTPPCGPWFHTSLLPSTPAQEMSPCPQPHTVTLTPLSLQSSSHDATLP